MRSETGFDVLYAAVIDGVGHRVRRRRPDRIGVRPVVPAHGLVSLMIIKPNMGWPRDDTLVDSILTGIDGIRPSRGDARGVGKPGSKATSTSGGPEGPIPEAAS
jgi:hypothetical protein